MADGRRTGDQLGSKWDGRPLCKFYTGFVEAVKLSEFYFERSCWPLLGTEWSVEELTREQIPGDKRTAAGSTVVMLWMEHGWVPGTSHK